MVKKTIKIKDHKEICLKLLRLDLKKQDIQIELTKAMIKKQQLINQ